MLTDIVTHEGYQLLWLLCSYLELDSLIGLDAHTKRTLEMIEEELLVFRNELKVCIDFVSILAGFHTQDKLMTVGIT